MTERLGLCCTAFIELPGQDVHVVQELSNEVCELFCIRWSYSVHWVKVRSEVADKSYFLCPLDERRVKQAL